MAYSFTVTFILLKIVDAVVGGLRVEENDEIIGLDITQHEENAYTLID